MSFCILHLLTGSRHPHLQQPGSPAQQGPNLPPTLAPHAPSGLLAVVSSTRRDVRASGRLRKYVSLSLSCPSSC